ncbi:mono/diheme cytochrome c family protein [Rhodanobacter sp. A1T4]|nr:mono/diheme cytochrome c family protein [Rhodanobacter sp. A1T4]
MMKWLRRVMTVFVLSIAVLAGWFFFRRDHAEPLPVAMRTVDAAMLKDPVLIARGEYLAKAGDCSVCHTEQGGQPYAGGRSVATPFGDIPAPNITPDNDTGLGNWSFEDFWRVLHSGIGRDGALLYPAFSYTAFTKVHPDDALAIFAYLRSLPPIHQTSKPPNLRFPYGIRNTLIAWRLLYFHEGQYRPDTRQSAQWNRGAYLVQGLGHCNECHDTRNALGALSGRQSLSGGEIPAQNWYAPDLGSRQNGGLAGWSGKDIVDLLKTGQSAKGVALGPMAEVVTKSTQYLADDDLQAIAVYLQSLPERPMAVAPKEAFNSKALADQGEKIYAQQCASCHGQDGNGVDGIYPPLNGNVSVTEPVGMNATRVVLLGGFSPGTVANPRAYSMPPFAQQLSDADVAAVVSYVRQAWSNHAPVVQERDISKYRTTPVD